jgi:hypothetical protein
MVWFKVDDAFGRHRKVRRLGKTDKLAAVGLWLLSGTWSAADTADGGIGDGFLPRDQVQEWDPKLRYAKRLIEVGFWEETEHDGEPGYQFHDWKDYQPTKASIESERTKWQQKKAAQRGKQAVTGTEREVLSPGDNGGTREGHAGLSTEDDMSREDHDGVTRTVTEENRTHVLNAPVVRPQPPVDGPHPRNTMSDNTHPQLSPGDTQVCLPEFPVPVPVPVPSSGSVGGEGYVPARAATPPPPRCPKHLDKPTTDACRPCGDARQARNTWDEQQAQAQRAARLAASRCPHCDAEGRRWHHDGKRHGTIGPCDHKPLRRKESA